MPNKLLIIKIYLLLQMHFAQDTQFDTVSKMLPKPGILVHGTFSKFRSLNMQAMKYQSSYKNIFSCFFSQLL